MGEKYDLVMEWSPENWASVQNYFSRESPRVFQLYITEELNSNCSV